MHLNSARWILCGVFSELTDFRIERADEVVSIDGKTWARKSRIVLGYLKVTAKNDEITAILKLFALLAS